MSRPATGSGRGAGAVGRAAASVGKKADGGRGASAVKIGAKGGVKGSAGEADRGIGANADRKGREKAGASGGTALQRCVRDELARHFALLDGEPPSDLYRLVMQQVEASLIDSVLKECGGNRSQAAAWLGISRGTLRGKLADHDSD